MSAYIQTFNPFTVAGVSVTVLEGEEHGRSAQMTEQVCETGKIISDHIILKPRTVTLQFEESNVMPGKSTANFVRQLFNTLENMWSARLPVTLYTIHCNYKNMVVESMSGIHKAPVKWRIKFTATFKQINQVTTGFSSIPVKEMANIAQMPEYQAGVRGVPQTPVYDGTPFPSWAQQYAAQTQTFGSNENSVSAASSP